jgi:hypothetical protein
MILRQVRSAALACTWAFALPVAWLVHGVPWTRASEAEPARRKAEGALPGSLRQKRQVRRLETADAKDEGTDVGSFLQLASIDDAMGSLPPSPSGAPAIGPRPTRPPRPSAPSSAPAATRRPSRAPQATRPPTSTDEPTPPEAAPTPSPTGEQTPVPPSLEPVPPTEAPVTAVRPGSRATSSPRARG